MTQLRQTDSTNAGRAQILIDKVSLIIRCLGYGLPDDVRATTNTDHRTTFITSGEQVSSSRLKPISIRCRSQLNCAVQADEFDIRIEVTLSYVAQPRRTRRNLRRYLSTWVDWKSSKLGEGINDPFAYAR